MALSLVSVEPEIIFADGGYPIEVIGTFPAGQDMRVHIGPNGDSTDAVAYSGKPGVGSSIRPFRAGRIRVYTPMLEPGGPYHIFVVAPDVPESGVLASVLTAVKPEFQTSVFALRSVMPPIYQTGPRSMDALEPV
jgi:hypothetical protein